MSAYAALQMLVHPRGRWDSGEVQRNSRLGDDPVDHLSVEFVNVGSWLTNGDTAFDSGAEFLAVAEHRLIHARAKSVGHQLRKAGLQSVWAPACQDQIAGFHAREGVISLHGAPLSAPFLVSPECREFFFWLGRVFFPLFLAAWCICLLCTGIRERRRIQRSFRLQISC